MNSWPEISINSWKEFTDVIEHLKLQDDWFPNYLFRGQSKVEWTLKPSILRILDEFGITRELGLKYEKTIFREFKIKVHHYPKIKPEDFKTGNVVLLNSIMQHYGAPTRLLDWTASPFIALYFAVCSNFDDHAGVFIFNQSTLGTLMNNPSYTEDSDLLYKNEQDSDHISAIMTNYETMRYSFQQGSFTVGADISKDHYLLIYNALKTKINKNNSPLCKLIISNNLKFEFLSRLRKLNIRPDILFPDLEGFSASLFDLLKLRAWQSSKSKLS